VHGVAVSFAPILGFIGSKVLPASTHSVTSGKTVEKMFASRFTSLKGGGRRGTVRPKPTSMVMDTLASTRAREPSARTSPAAGVVVFAYGAPVELFLFPQSAAAFVDSLALRRGRFTETNTSAWSLSRNSKPTGMVGLNARPSKISTSVTLTLKGSGVRVDP
jgi:hypothetical protein